MSAAVVVDAYSTGAKLAPRFAAAGLPVVHVQSSPRMPDFYLRSFRAEHFVANVVHDGDLDATVAQLAAHDPAFVVVGSEPGVLLADALSERLGLPSNGTALSPARRDKHAMAQALRAAGLRAVEELKTGDAGAAIAWAEDRGSWPVVVKPLDSAGTDGVSLCEDAASIEAAFAALLGRPNALQGANRELLVQELLTGTQLFFNSISWEGVHHISEIWQDNKRRIAGNLVYDYEELLPRQGTKQDQVAPYVEQVLDALGIRFGPAHTEVMLTAERPGAGRVGSAPARLGPRRRDRPLHTEPPRGYGRGLPRPRLGGPPRRPALRVGGRGLLRDADLPARGPIVSADGLQRDRAPPLLRRLDRDARAGSAAGTNSRPLHVSRNALPRRHRP